MSRAVHGKKIDLDEILTRREPLLPELRPYVYEDGWLHHKFVIVPPPFNWDRAGYINNNYRHKKTRVTELDTDVGDGPSVSPLGGRREHDPTDDLAGAQVVEGRVHLVERARADRHRRHAGTFHQVEKLGHVGLAAHIGAA